MRLALAALVVSLGMATEAAGKPMPPDPRKGERLDGRAPYRDPYRYALFVPRAVLLLPRVLAYSILAPAAEATEYVEENHWVARIDRFLTSDDRLIKVRPTARVESGFIPSLGLRWADRRTLGPGTLMGASFRAGAGVLDTSAVLRPWRIPLTLHGGFDRDPNAVFGGINGETREELEDQGRDVARYGFDRYVAALTWEGRRRERFQYAVTLDAMRADYGNGDARGGDAEIEDVFCADPAAGCMGMVDEGLVPGFNQGMRLLGAGAAIALDSRGNERFATGAMLVLSGRAAVGVSGDPSRHAGGEATLCLTKAVGERELDLCGKAGLVEPLGDAPVPFEELMTPGGSDGIRAVSSGRLRGRSELVATVEYRWLLGAWIDASLFFDIGGAFGPRFENVDTEHLIPGVGVAFRYVKHEPRFYYWRANPIAGLQLAYAPEEGLHLLFSVTR